MNPFRNRDVIDITDFSRDNLEWLFMITDYILEQRRPLHDALRGKILAYAFFEPSTRTRLSFESAMKRLGGDTIGFARTMETSVRKGEKFVDTLRMLDMYSDVIVVRHPLEGAAKLAAEICKHPVINGGDGRFQHPTQTMLDLYTIYREFGEIDGLTIGILGDLRFARTINSLLMGLCLFNPKKIFLISPEILKPREMIIEYLKKHNMRFEILGDVNDAIGELDVLYVVRIQKERFPDPAEYERIKGSYRITLEILKNARDTLKIMHPLPKIDELDPEIDNTKYALYFKQASYGLYVRMALLLSILIDDPLGILE